MPLVDHVDYPSRRIYLSVETADTSLDTMAVYREVRALRRTVEAHRQFPPMIEGGGNLEKIPGVSYTQPYVRLLRGCRIVPANVTHQFTVIRETFTDDGFAGVECFDRLPLSASVVVDISVNVPQYEVRQVAVSGNEYTLAQIAAAVAAHPDTLTVPLFLGLK